MLSLCSILIENVSNLVIFTGIRFIIGGLISSFESCALSIIRYHFPKSYRTTAYEFIPASFYMPFLITILLIYHVKIVSVPNFSLKIIKIELKGKVNLGLLNVINLIFIHRKLFAIF